MDKKRAKEIAILEWEGIVEYIQQKDFSPAGKDISTIKESVVGKLFYDDSITIGELSAVQDHYDCALCAFFLTVTVQGVLFSQVFSVRGRSSLMAFYFIIGILF